MLGIDDTPSHRGRGGAMQIDESSAETFPVGVEDVVDLALPVKRDGTRFVPRHKRKTHLFEQSFDFARLRMAEFHKVKSVGAGRVFGADFGWRRVMRERAHGSTCAPRQFWSLKI